MADKVPVGVCGMVPGDVEALAGLVRAAEFDAVTVHWPDRAGLDAARAAQAQGYLLIGASEPACAALAAELATLSKPVVAIGGAAPATATCWLAQRPSPTLLKTLLLQLMTPAVDFDSEPPPSRTWRRKSDMIIGVSAAMTQLLATLDRLAPSVAPVLITGESGTGKELVARALHYTGLRAMAPFIAINCAAIPETLFESELFGYHRGAFTGAVAARPGAFESADGGTLFLDEIGEMPLSMQVKLLRVLETGEVTRLGSNESRRLNVRVVAATNRKLETEVQSGRFREDLFYRVSVYPVHIAPLRERPEDIAPLVIHHLEEIARRERRTAPRLTHAGLEKLLRHRWPGNVRELVNMLERAILLAEQGAIDAQHIVIPEDESMRAIPLIAAYKDAKEKFERRYYAQVLRTAGGNISLVAKLAQKTRKEIYDALKRLDMDAERFRGGAEDDGSEGGSDTS